MQTQCPKCKTIFRLNSSQLEEADGLVCCGHCQQIFKAMSHPSGIPFHGNLFAENDDPIIETGVENPETENDPETLRMLLLGHKTAPNRNLAGWAFGIITLSLAALLQFAYIERDYLLEYPKLKPFIEQACEFILGCEFTPKRDLNKIELISRNVYTHPNVKDALMISAVLNNSASIVQAYPTLLITMSNTRGKIVAQRYFSPGEYLGPAIDIEAGMQIGTPVAITLEIMDPGNEALAFELDFL